MAYRIFFSGLIAFVESKDFDRVDVLLLNPCPAGHPPADGDHADGHGAHADQHVPHLTVKMDDISEWMLDGVLHGCGSHHFDLTGKILFPGLDGVRKIDASGKRLKKSTKVDPIGDVRVGSFRDGIIDLNKVRKNAGELGAAGLKVLASPVTGKNSTCAGLIAARVRLPPGQLSVLVERNVGPWKIGSQELDELSELVMFVPDDQSNRRIDMRPASGTADEFVTVKADKNVDVWISDEPVRKTRSVDPNNAPHFAHFYDLIPRLNPVSGRVNKQGEKFLPELQRAAFNIDTPLCPPCLVHCEDLP